MTDFCNLVMGQSPSSSTFNIEGKGLPFYQGKKEFGKIYPTPIKFCSEPIRKAKKGDILISVRAPVGPSNISPHKACIGRGLAAIRPLHGIKTNFVFYLIKNIEPSISNKGTGSTFKAISKNFLENLEFALPPLPEQNRIVNKIEELFSELDHGIESLQKAQAQLKTYRQAVLKHAFEGKLTQNWRRQNNPEPAERLLERIKEERENYYQKQLEKWQRSCEQAKKEGKKKPTKPKELKTLPRLDERELAKLNDLPRGWCWTYFEYLGLWTGGGTPNKGKEEYWQNGDILWISPKDMKT